MARIGLLAWSFCVAAAAAVSFVGCGREAPAAAGEWSQFRGPSGLGVLDSGDLPTTWGEGSANVRWRTPLPGRGNSSPIVSGDRIFLTTAIEEPVEGQRWPRVRRLVLVLDLATGRLLRQTEIYVSPGVKLHRFNSYAAPTPVADGESVYAYFGSHLSRLTRDGEVVWTKEIDPSYERFTRYGAASSPILAGDTVIIVQDREEAGDTEDKGWMAAFRRDSGEEVWRRQWDKTCCSYSTPLVWRRPGAGEELVFAYSGSVVAHDPATGERLWHHDYPMWQFVGGLVVDGNVVCALGGAHNQKGNVCARVTGRGKRAKVERLWHEPRRAPETSSAVLYRGRLYAVTENGVMSCYDPTTGKVHWMQDLERGRAFRASLVAGDGKVYAVPTRGPAAVIDATTDEYRVLALNELAEDGSNATPAIGGGCLLLRSTEHLLCIEKEAPAAG